MSLRIKAALAVFAAVTLFVFGMFASGRVQIVRHWNLYAAAGATQPYRLFLGPFPSAHTCEIERERIIGAGGHSFCASRLVVSLDREREKQLFWEFLSAANPWTRLCGPRRG
jgi:hypothetical protein